MITGCTSYSDYFDAELNQNKLAILVLLATRANLTCEYIASKLGINKESAADAIYSLLNDNPCAIEVTRSRISAKGNIPMRLVKCPHYKRNSVIVKRLGLLVRKAIPL